MCAHFHVVSIIVRKSQIKWINLHFVDFAAIKANFCVFRVCVFFSHSLSLSRFGLNVTISVKHVQFQIDNVVHTFYYSFFFWFVHGAWRCIDHSKAEKCCSLSLINSSKIYIALDSMCVMDTWIHGYEQKPTERGERRRRRQGRAW